MTATVDPKKVDPDKVVDVDIFSEETRQNWFELAAEWATRPPFYVINHETPQVVISRYADVRDALMSKDRFTTEPPATATAHFDAFMGLPHLAVLNGEAHDRIRQILQPWIGAAGVAKLHAEIERHVNELIDEVEQQGGPAEVVEGFARKLFRGSCSERCSGSASQSSQCSSA